MPDLSDWSIQDQNSSLCIEGGRVSWCKADRTKVRYIGKDIEIRGDFYHSFVVCFLDGEVEDEFNRGFIRLWEVRNDWENRTWIYARKKGDEWTIFFEQLNNKDKVFAFEGSEGLQFGNRFIVKISRVDGVYRLVVQNQNELILEDSTGLVGVAQDYGHVWLASTIKSRRNTGNWSTGYIEDFTISSLNEP